MTKPGHSDSIEELGSPLSAFERARLASWVTVPPPADFAERTASAMLATRPREALPEPRRLERSRSATKRWGRFVLLAALVSASAWGALQVARGGGTAAAHRAVEEEAPRVAPSTIVVTHHTGRAEATREVAAEPTPVRSPVPSAPKPTPPAAQPASVPPRQVALPRCQCAPGFVVCGCSD